MAGVAVSILVAATTTTAASTKTTSSSTKAASLAASIKRGTHTHNVTAQSQCRRFGWEFDRSGSINIIKGVS